MSGAGRTYDQPERCTLEVRRLPSHLNTIACLNDYFSKFGTIVNLQIKYESDPEAAVVQFASHAEAAAAHRCPEAVLGNRFIKLFWHNKEQEKQDPAPDLTATADAGQTPAAAGAGGSEEGRASGDDASENVHSSNRRTEGAGGEATATDEESRPPAKERLDLKHLDDASFKMQVSVLLLLLLARH